MLYHYHWPHGPGQPIFKDPPSKDHFKFLIRSHVCGLGCTLQKNSHRVFRSMGLHCRHQSQDRAVVFGPQVSGWFITIPCYFYQWESLLSKKGFWCIVILNGRSGEGEEGVRSRDTGSTAQDGTSHECLRMPVVQGGDIAGALGDSAPRKLPPARDIASQPLS